MKKCPYCAEEIQDDAIKCRFCGEMLAKTNEEPPPIVSTIPKKKIGLYGWILIIFLGICVLNIINFFNNPDTNQKPELTTNSATVKPQPQEKPDKSEDDHVTSGSNPEYKSPVVAVEQLAGTMAYYEAPEGPFIKIQNDTKLVWINVELHLYATQKISGEGYTFKASRIGSGGNIYVTFESFTDSNGMRFNPWAYKAKTIVLYCDTYKGKGTCSWSVPNGAGASIR